MPTLSLHRQHSSGVRTAAKPAQNKVQSWSTDMPAGRKGLGGQRDSPDRDEVLDLINVVTNEKMTRQEKKKKKGL